MITLQNNPIVVSPSHPYGIPFAITRDVLTDTDIYSRFIYNIENQFRKSKFYKDYRASLYNLGLNRSQKSANITSDMASLEMHHNFLELKFATIMIIEHLLNIKGCVTSFEVINELEECHRQNMFPVIILTVTEHQVHHSDPTDFISLRQCASSDTFAFILKYLDGMQLDIAYKMLLHLKLEKQHGESFSPNTIKVRDLLLDWSQFTNNQLEV